MQKKRPCSVCRRWFLPDARVGDRQRTCGSAECRRARHRRVDRDWHARHPDYDRGRRWQKKQEQAEENGAPSRPETPPLSGVPLDVAQDAMGLQAVVIILELAKVLVRHAQDEKRVQVPVFKSKSGRHGARGAQDEMERGPPARVG
jgi:hypothetical protein